MRVGIVKSEGRYRYDREVFWYVGRGCKAGMEVVYGIFVGRVRDVYGGVLAFMEGGYGMYGGRVWHVLKEG